MTQQPLDPAGDPRRHAIEVLATLLRDAKSRGLGAALQDGLAGPAFQQVLAELGRLDPELQKRIARAVVESRGDPDAVRAAIEAAPIRPAAGLTRAQARRPPTVVDGRQRFPWVGLFVAAMLAIAAWATFLR